MTIDNKYVAPVSDRTVDNGPVCKRELDWLKTHRAEPAPVPECTLGGASSSNTRWLNEQHLAAREHYIETRLRRVDGQTRSGFSLAKMNDRARYDFAKAKEREP